MPSATATATTTTAVKPAKKTAAKKRQDELPPTADLQMEAYLHSLGFSARLEEAVPLTEIDEKASLRNQARVGQPVDRRLVDDYATAMRNGTVFPALVAWEKSGNEPLILVDGNHRLQALKKVDRVEYDVYIIRDAEPRKISLLTMLINTRHGKASTEKDRIAAGLYFVDQNISVKEAAAMLGISTGKLQSAVNQNRADARAVRLGVDPIKWDRLPAGQRIRLNQIYADEVFASMAKLTIEAHLAPEDVGKAVGQLSELRRFEEQMKYVEDLRSVFANQIQPGGELDAPGRGRQGNSPVRQYRMALGQMRILPPPEFALTRLTDHDRKELADRTRDGITKLTEYLKVLESAPAGQ